MQQRLCTKPNKSFITWLAAFRSQPATDDFPLHVRINSFCFSYLRCVLGDRRRACQLPNARQEPAVSPWNWACRQDQIRQYRPACSQEPVDFSTVTVPNFLGDCPDSLPCASRGWRTFQGKSRSGLAIQMGAWIVHPALRWSSKCSRSDLPNGVPPQSPPLYLWPIGGRRHRDTSVSFPHAGNGISHKCRAGAGRN